MNLKTTPILFGLLLTILFLFGLMLVYKKTPVDENLIMPKMQGDVEVDTVRFNYHGKDKDEEVVFLKQNELWYLKQASKQARVEGFRIEEMVRNVKMAKVNEDAKVQSDPSAFDLPPGKPRITVTLSGKLKNADQKWEFFIGKEAADKAIVYVNSSDRPGRGFPVARSSIESLLFKDTATLRSKRLFDLVEPTVTAVKIKEADKELALKKVEDNWFYVNPPIGFADSTGGGDEPPAKKDFKDFKDQLKEPKAKSSGGVKELIIAIARIQVDKEEDFEPLGKEVDEKSATMILELVSGTEKPEKAEKDEKDEKEKAKKEEKVTREALIVGKEVVPPASAKKEKVEKQYYARMRGDDGVFRINAKQLDLIKQAVADPTRIRSSDVVMFDPAKVDAITIKQTRVKKDDKQKEVTESDETKLLHPDDKDWQVVAGGSTKVRKGSDKGIAALLESLQGKRAIETFGDGKDDAWAGLNKDAGRIEVTIYLGGLEKEKKDEKKKADKKGKDDKDKGKDEKKGEKKEDEKPASLKDKAKPYVTIIIGTIDKAKKIAYVKRELAEAKPSYFTIPESYVEKLKLEEGSLAFVDPALPKINEPEIAAVELQRGKEKLDLDRFFDDKTLQVRYTLKDAVDSTGAKLADRTKFIMLTGPLTRLQARKWVKIDDADKLGLKDPQATVTLYTRSEEWMNGLGKATLLGMGATPMPGVPQAVLPPFGPWMATRFEDKSTDKDKKLADKVTIKFGKEIEEDKVKLVYAQHSGSDLAFLVPADLLKSIKEADLRDRSALGHTQAQIDASLLAIGSSLPIDMTPLASPLVTGVLHDFDPLKAKTVHVTVRSPFELRSFKFASQVEKPKEPEKGKDDKEKKDDKKGEEAKGEKKDDKKADKEKDKPKLTWVDQSGIPEFQVDSDKVNQLVEQIAKLRTERFASFGGVTADTKATDKEFKLRIEITFENSAVTLTVGTHFGQLGYFAHSTAWPDAVFFLPMGTVEPILRGTDYFGKERATATE